VEPRERVEQGEAELHPILVITSLDNPAHVEVVKLLCRYLHQWCGLGPTYFALDEEWGVGGGDPWKWCQETGASVRQQGDILFIAGPDPAVTRETSLHPNLAANQAFLSTTHLQEMAGEGRVHVITLPYSRLAALPKEVPEHLARAAYHLPRQLGALLLHLLHLPLAPLCPLAPLPCVPPRVGPADLAREPGPTLVAKMEELASSLAKEERVARVVGRREEGEEVRTLLPRDVNEEGCTLLPREEGEQKEVARLEVEVETGLPSLRGMEGRDTTTTDGC